jgi:hypothetical protein
LSFCEHSAFDAGSKTLQCAEVSILKKEKGLESCETGCKVKVDATEKQERMFPNSRKQVGSDKSNRQNEGVGIATQKSELYIFLKVVTFY